MEERRKQNTGDLFRAGLVRDARYSARYELPLLRQTRFRPERAIPFDKAMRAKDYGQWVHFYTDDARFERIWRNPTQYLARLKRFEGAITPDFSIYRAMPLAMQIWNTYRNRTLAYWLQSNGIDIVPNIRWGDERTYEFAFEGIEQGGTVAVSTNGCIQNKINRYYFQKGLAKMVDVLKPNTIVNYSCTPDDIFSIYKGNDINIIQIENYLLTARKAVV